MIHGNGRIKRLIAGGVLGLAALAFAPTADAAISTTAFCQNVPTGQSGFTDIAQAGVHQRNVECLKATGITQGTTATTYSPTANVSRGQMATFIANKIDFARANDAPGGATIPALPTAAQSQDRFTDDETSVHENNINRLAQAGIVQGTSATTFSPSDPVSRAQMATFLAEADEFIRGAELPIGNDRFTDDETSVHENNINRIANAGIADGTTATTYNPDGLVSRAQMASFIVQNLADLHADGFITAIPPQAGAVNFPSNRSGVQFHPVNPTTGEAASFAVEFSGLTNVQDGDVDVSLVALSNEDTDFFVMPTGNGFVFLDEDLDGIADGVGADGDPGTTTHGVDHSNPDMFLTSAGTTSCGPSLSVLFCDDAEPVVDELLVRVDFEDDPSDSAWIVVWDDLDGDDVLDLNAANQPTEPFGIAGPIVTNAGELAFGDSVDDDAYFVDTTTNRIWLMDEDGFFVQYGRAGDTYQYDGTPISEAEFEAALSTNDGVETVVNYNPAGGNVFNLEDDRANMPTGVTATAGDFDQTNDTASDDIRVTWTAPADPDGRIDHYDVYVDGVFTTSSTGPATNAVITEQAPGTYQIRVETVTVFGGTSSLSEPASVTVTAPPPGPVAGAPISTSAVFQDSEPDGVISDGDTLVVTFNEPMAAPNPGDSITITDGDGTVVTITNGTNATFTVNGTVLSIALTGAPVTSVAGTTPGAQYGSSAVTASTGVTDADENLEWDKAGSSDVTF